MKLATEAELMALHTGNVKESLHLEYKASDAVDKKNDTKKVELARDVCAFANADGGQIVYGMAEKDHEPAGLDAGVDPKEYPEIWFEQVLQQHVTPNIVGVRPRHVPLSNGRVAVVIDVPAAKGDPHQVSDNRYYRRHNFNRFAMEHYEIRDAMTRRTSPDLYLNAELLTSAERLTFQPGAQHSNPVTIVFHIGNRSNTPAMYTVVHLNISPRLTITSMGDFTGPHHHQDQEGHSWALFTKRIAIPSHFPIFKESPFSLNDRSFHVAFPSVAIGQSQYYPLTALIKSPGFDGHQRWQLRQINNEVTLEVVM